MTRKDYKKIAEAIRESVSPTHVQALYSLNALLKNLTVVFEADDLNFNKDKFIESLKRSK